MTRLTAMAILVALALVGPVGRAAPEETQILSVGEEHKPIHVDIATLTWLSGQWRGAALGGEVEEAWMRPAAGTMAGVYRLVKDGRVVFYEIMTLGESNGYTAMRLKHFHANLEGWEKRTDVVEFPLLRISDDALYFDGMTMIRRGANLDMHVRIDDRERGTHRIEVFHYRRGGSL